MMRAYGHTILRHKPYTAYAYDESSREPLPETAHLVTNISIVGHMSSSASEAWKTADGSRSYGGRSIEDATASVIALCAHLQGRHGDRVISAAQFALIASYAIPEDEMPSTPAP
jgi:hypothetical protein